MSELWWSLLLLSAFGYTIEGLTVKRCGTQVISNRIVGGNFTGIDEYPWTALLRYVNHEKGTESWGCGGTYIGGKSIVTAAQCVEATGATGELKFVRLGEYDTGTELDCVDPDGQNCADPPLDLQLDRIIIHPDRERNPNSKENDIALVILEKEPPYTDFIRPICLPKFNDINDLRRQLFVAGWGWTVGIVQSPSAIKQDLNVQLVNTTMCKELYRDTVINGASQICAGGHNGTNPCRGDSGGPLMSTKDGENWTLAGIVSYGPRVCAVRGFDERPAIFTNIEHYLVWIFSNAV